MERESCINGKINHGYGNKTDAPECHGIGYSHNHRSNGKVTHKEHSGGGINTQETRDIAVDVTMTFRIVLSITAVY